MRIVDRPAVIALGVTTLCLLSLTSPLTSPLHIDIYHSSGSVIGIYLAGILNICALWLLLAGLFWLVRKPGRPRTIVWLGMILFLPWIVMRNVAAVMVWPLSHPFSMTVLAFSTTAFIGCLAFWRPTFQPAFDRISGFAATLLAFVAFSGAVVLIQLLWLTWQARSLNAARPLHQQQVASIKPPPTPRIVWIVLDELSYQQVYERRFPGLQLPTFDQLASQSTVFTHVIPVGIRTEAVLPSLMTGIQVDRIRSSSDGQLLIHDQATKAWQQFDQHNTIFQDALNNGYSTAIAGWYNPYCRILPQVLDHCFWTVHTSEGAFRSQSFMASLLDPVRGLIQKVCAFILLKGDPPVDTALDNQFHIEDYHNLFKAADSQLADRSVNFIFLHMPIPHPGGIYNRKTSTFVTSQSSYIDNLALADRYLEHVYQVLQRQGTWDSSVVIVMGDHSWRTALIWRDSPYWTMEDKIASKGGQFDDRPGYIVKMPYQQKAMQINTPFAALRTRALLDAIINHKISSAGDLAVWVKQK